MLLIENGYMNRLHTLHHVYLRSKRSYRLKVLGCSVSE